MTQTDWQRIYTELGGLISQEPEELQNTWRPSPPTLLWLGRVQAVIESTGYTDAVAEVRTAMTHIRDRTLHQHGIGNLRAVMYRVLALAEYKSPSAMAGAFIPVGQPFDAFAAIGRLMSTATRNVLIVDPYMDEKALTDFAVLAPEGVLVRLLADEHSKKAGLLPAVQRWATQHGPKRPLQARLAPARLLHDRLVATDDKDAWALTQSLNAFAQRSPATILKADPETAALKIAAFNDIWNNALPIT
jgi:hypothetical protein